MEAMEEITPVFVKDLTREQAQELLNDRQLLVSRLRTEIDLLKEKIWPELKIKQVLECEVCHSTNIRPRTNGTYFCAKCGFSSGVP